MAEATYRKYLNHVNPHPYELEFFQAIDHALPEIENAQIVRQGGRSDAEYLIFGLSNYYYRFLINGKGSFVSPYSLGVFDRDREHDLVSLNVVQSETHDYEIPLVSLLSKLWKKDSRIVQITIRDWSELKNEHLVPVKDKIKKQEPSATSCIIS